MDIRTDEAVLDGRRALICRPGADGPPGPWPGVVMIHEIFGINDVLRRQAERLASAGYLVVCPDLLGDGPWIGCVLRAFRSLQAQRGRPFEIVESVRSGLAADPECTGRVGVIGFCMGGGFALLSASRGFDAASVNYGMVPENIDDVLRGACPIVASYGERDRLFRDVPRLEQALVAAEIPYDLQTYPSAGHSFLNDEAIGPSVLRPLMKVAHVGPDPVAAADAWQRIEAFFTQHLTNELPKD